MINIKKNIWWMVAAGGIGLISMGILTFLFPLQSYFKYIKYCGTILLINSILLFIFSLILSRQSTETKWLLAECGLDFIFAIILMFNPLLTFFTFPVLFGLWLTCFGIFKILAGLLLKDSLQKSYPVLFAGILFCIFGILLFRGQYGSVSNVNTIFGLFGVILGAVYLIDSIRYRTAGNTLDFLL